MMVWEMGFQWIRHSALDLRSVYTDRAPKGLTVRGENDWKIGEAGERELVLVVGVRCGKERDMSRG